LATENKTIKVCVVHLFSTSPNLYQRTTVLKADAPNRIDV